MTLLDLFVFYFPVCTLDISLSLFSPLPFSHHHVLLSLLFFFFSVEVRLTVETLWFSLRGPVMDNAGTLIALSAAAVKSCW